VRAGNTPALEALGEVAAVGATREQHTCSGIRSRGVAASREALERWPPPPLWRCSRGVAAAQEALGSWSPLPREHAPARDSGGGRRPRAREHVPARKAMRRHRASAREVGHRRVHRC
jgi:hypothetical protein